MVTLEDIKTAREKIEKYIYKTPVIRLNNMDNILGCKVYIKPECMQKTNSFKIRGALNKMLSLSENELKNGVVAASSGNHGKGVAFAAKLLGIKATIVLPDTATDVKVEGIKALGAETVMCEISQRHIIAGELSRKYGYHIIHPYDDYAIIAGQGTAGLEIMEQLPDVDYVVVPIGGGGLISGIATAVKSINSNAKVIGVEPALLSRYTESIKEGKRVLLEAKKSLADALLTLQPGEKNFPIVQKYVDCVVGVNEEFISMGEKMLLLEGKILAEPSSSIGIGAVLEKKINFKKEDKVCFLVSGGNVGINQIAKL